jgi:hypothetical protein
MKVLHGSHNWRLPEALPEDCHGPTSFAAKKRTCWAGAGAFSSGQLAYCQREIDLPELPPLAGVKIPRRLPFDWSTRHVDCTSRFSDVPRHFGEV